MRTTRRDSRRMTSIRRGSRPELGGERRRHRRGRDLAQAQQAALGLRDDLLAEHEHVAGGQRRALARGGLHHDARDVVAGPHLADALDADDLVARVAWSAPSDRAGARPGARRSASSSSRRPLSVAAPSASSTREVLGRVDVEPEPRQRARRGRRAAAPARPPGARRTTARRSAAASPPAAPAATPLVPSPEREGAKTTARRRRQRLRPARGSRRRVTHGTSPGMVRKTRGARRAALGLRGGDGGGVAAVLRPRPAARRPASARASATSGLARHHPHRGRGRAAARACSTSLQHRARQLAALGGVEHAHRAAAWRCTRSLTGTAATIMRPGPRP